MAKKIQTEGKTLREAIDNALEQLNVSEDEVSVEIVDEGTKGLLGILGSKKTAKVIVTLKDDPDSENDGEDDYEEEVFDGSKSFDNPGENSKRVQKGSAAGNKKDFLHDFLSDLFRNAGVEAGINIDETDDEVAISISGGDDIGMFIGRRGETMDALQYIVSLVANKGDHYKKITLDIESYRRRREETLAALACRIAEKVRKTRKNVTLEPMSPYERRIIHMTLQSERSIKTYSVGNDPNRKVVVSYSYK